MFSLLWGVNARAKRRMNDPSTARKAPCGGREGEKVDSGGRRKRGKKRRRGWRRRRERRRGRGGVGGEVEEEGRRKGNGIAHTKSITSEQVC